MKARLGAYDRCAPGMRPYHSQAVEGVAWRPAAWLTGQEKIKGRDKGDLGRCRR